MVKYILAVVLTACITALLTTKAIAAYHFKVIDSYVKDMIDLAKQEIKIAYINQDKR